MLFFSSKIFKTIKVLVFLAAVGAAIYFGYNYYDLKSKMPETKQPEQEQKPIDDGNNPPVNPLKDIIVTDSNVVNAMKNFKTIALTESQIYGGFKVEDLNKKQLLFTALENLDSTKLAYCASDESQLINITISDLNEALGKVVKQELTMDDVKSNIAPSSSFTLASYSISYNLKEYGINLGNGTIQVIGSCHGMADPTGDNILTKLVEANKDDTNLYVYEKVAFGKYLKAEGNDFIFNFYNDVNKTNKIESLVNDENTVRELDWTKYKTYKYTFKIDGNKCYFESVELSK